ncbi:MAG: DNA-binding domain-containing protein, partial [Nitratireductor sp.]|nr:DNA-binding domain-containing protein [Nitratireductor sp.]
MNREIRSAAAINGIFAGALLDPDIPIPDGLTGPDGEAAPKRYGVYRNNVVVSLMEALAGVFPSVRAIMGEENFNRVARNFVAFHPPRSPLMQHYGGEFPAFLEGFAPLRKYPWLADVARLERGFLDAYHAADAPCLRQETLAALPADAVQNLRFEPHPASFLMASPFAVVDLFGWRDGRPDAAFDPGDPQCALVTRPLLVVEMRPIGRAQHDFLAMLIAGETLGEAAGAALEADPAFDISGTLALAFAAGAFRQPEGGGA